MKFIAEFIESFRDRVKQSVSPKEPSPESDDSLVSSSDEDRCSEESKIEEQENLLKVEDKLDILEESNIKEQQNLVKFQDKRESSEEPHVKEMENVLSSEDKPGSSEEPIPKEESPIPDVMQPPCVDVSVGQSVGHIGIVSRSIGLGGTLQNFVSTLNLFPQDGQANLAIGAVLFILAGRMLFTLPEKRKPDNRSRIIEVLHYGLTGPMLATGVTFIVIGMRKIYS